MFALVESGSITRMLNGRQGVTVDGVQHPRTIFTLWTEAERNAIGIYTVDIDESKRKNEQWYKNTNITYAFDGSKVTGSYGDATAKAHADTKWTQAQIDAGEAPEGADTNTVAVEGLKTKLIRDVKKKAQSQLNITDWYITRKAEKDTAIPSSITTHRDAVRTKQAEMETAITNASDTPALQTLYTSVDGNPRPIGSIPTLEV